MKKQKQVNEIQENNGSRLEGFLLTVSVLVIIGYSIGHLIMQSMIANYNITVQDLELEVLSLQSETASLDRERHQLTEISRVSAVAESAGLEFQPHRRVVFGSSSAE